MTVKLKLILLSIIIVIFAIISYFYIDLDLAIFFKNFDKNFVLVFKYITKIGHSTWILVLSLLLYLVYRKSKEQIAKKGLFVFLSIAASGILVDILKIIFSKARPKLYFADGIYGFNFLEFKTQASYYSFPSGHSSTALSLAVALMFLFSKYRIPLFIMGVIVAFSRVVVTAHYLSDTLIGGLIGGLMAYYLYYKYFEKKFNSQKATI